MNSWQPFTWIYESFNGPFRAAVNGMAANLSGGVTILATAMATLYIAITFTIELYSGGGGNPIMDLVRRCGRVALILGCLTAATYTGTIATFLLTTMPNDLSAAIVGNGTIAGAPAFDKLLGSIWAAGNQVWTNISGWDVGAYVVLGLGVWAYEIIATIGIGIAFVLWVVTQVSLGLLVAIGPLAIVCLLLPQTARYFGGWLSAVVTALVAQVLYTTLIVLLITTIQVSLAQITGANGATGANGNDIGDQMHMLVDAGAIILIAGFISLSIVPLARGIGGGAAGEASAVSRWAHGALGAGAKAAGASVTSGAPSAPAGLAKGGAAGMRSINPVGKAL